MVPHSEYEKSLYPTVFTSERFNVPASRPAASQSVKKRKGLSSVYSVRAAYFILFYFFFTASQLSVQHEPNVFGKTLVCHGSDAERGTDGLN